MRATLSSLVAFLLPLLFCLALLDIALRSLQYHKIDSLRRQGDRRAQKLFQLLASPERAISLLLFLRHTGSSLCFLLIGALLVLYSLPAVWYLLLVPAILFPLLLLLEYVPRMIAVHSPERIAFTFLKPFEWLLALNRYLPLPRLSETLTSAVLRLYGLSGERIFSEYSLHEIRQLLAAGHSNEELELRSQVIGYRFQDLSQRRVREVMVARPLVKAIDVNTPLRIVLITIRENGFSRMPVFRGNLDNMLGILHAKDILGASEPFHLEKHLRAPFFVPETVTVLSAFQTMQRNHVHLALVVDEYGGIEGIVTLEDLLEELVGEIEDEYDEQEEKLLEVSDGHWVLEGSLPIKDLNQNLNLTLPEDASSYTTVAGFILSVMDKIPSEKEQIRYGSFLFTIEKMAGNKISKLSLRIPAPLPAEEEG